MLRTLAARFYICQQPGRQRRSQSCLSISRLMSVIRMRRLLGALVLTVLLSTVTYYSLLVNVLPHSSSNPAKYEQRVEAGDIYRAAIHDVLTRSRATLVVVANKTIERRVLLVTNGNPLAAGKERPTVQDVAGSALASLQYAKYNHDVMRGGSAATATILEDESRAFYASVVFEDREAYADLPAAVRENLETYCRKYDVGIIVLPSSTALPAASLSLNPIPETPVASDTDRSYPFDGVLPISFAIGADVGNYTLLPVSLVLPSLSPQQRPPQPLYRLLRPDSVLPGDPLPGFPSAGWMTFRELHESYVTVATVCVRSVGLHVEPVATNISARKCSFAEEERPVVVLDPGSVDGIRRAFFGYRLNFWLHRPLFLDVLSYFTHGVIELPLERFVQIDIDDVFVGEAGTKLHAVDVEELLRTQQRWRSEHMARFTFYLGFSGQFYDSGSEDDKAGDSALIEAKDNFAWFCHTWSHSQPHTFENATLFQDQINMNWQFAQDRGLPVDTTYSVAPHHSGVYPTHDLLYDTWKSILGVQVTSTEEYPHLYPARLRRGFVYNGVKVLPRQVCGVYTKTLSYESYPGGPQRLDAMVNGGDLFDVFLYNPVNVFMTHQQNYGNKDRLAVYLFDKMFRFIKHYTSVELRWMPAAQLAILYFELYPEERWPVWTNPCVDKRHAEIWNPHKSCQSLPSFLIVGPQKTGTTALSSFLQLHPDIGTSRPDPVTFEEVHFFGTSNYYNGLDWYLSFFDHGQPPAQDSNASGQPPTLYFDKSANYFDSMVAPLQAHTLLPSAKIIIILLSPIDRAFSWYHHRRAHGDPAAISYEFYDVVTAKVNASKELLQLQARAIVPGFYASHIESWRKHFPDKQIMIVDGHELKAEPANVMYNVQKFLQLKRMYDYNTALVYEPRKKFFCMSTLKGMQCLGASKGRSTFYGAVDARSEEVLRGIYLEPNRRLKKLLDTMGYDQPSWLQDVT